MTGISGSLLSQAFLDAHVRDGSNERVVMHAFGPATHVRALLTGGIAPLLVRFGFGPPADIGETPPLVSATVAAGAHRIALLVAPFGHQLDPLWRSAVTEALRRSCPACLLFNGTHARLVDAARVYSRRFLDFDLDTIVSDARSIAALQLALSPALPSLVDASDRHRAGVCRSLRNGVLAASHDVLLALTAGGRRRRNTSLDDSFEQALTIVYRLLFLLFAEARALVPLWHPVYRRSYSVEALRAIAEQPTRSSGLWDALRAMTRLAHAGCRAGDLRVTPFNGRLFAPSRTPLADHTELDDAKACSAIVALSTRTAAGGRGVERITYRDLGVEQLGAVYETLLDYIPRRDKNGRVTLERESTIRKATGTFYTPQPIADYLVRRTLAPLVNGRAPDEILQLRIVDPAMGSGAFLVAACRYLAGAYEAALVESGACLSSDIADADRTMFRRLVTERCLYGVDSNPMAVQLARLSLWLATLAADRPLSFLDHRLVTGDSVLGAWLWQLRRPPRSGRTRSTGTAPILFDDAAATDVIRGALPIRFSLESTPNDTLAQVRDKERAHAAATARDAALALWKRVADLWCASWFARDGRRPPPRAFTELADAILHGTCALPERAASTLLADADAIAQSRRFFHWELEFPEVFFGGDGSRLAHAGFDAIIGNPPWDVVQDGEVLRFTRDAGAYRSQGDGHANQYQLFVERSMSLVRPAGRVGLVLPSGIATDHGSAALRRALLSTCDVDALVGFDNQKAVFPIHRSMRFVLASATSGRATASVNCRLGLDDPSVLDSVGEEPPQRSPWYPVRLSRETLERISGPALTIPHLTSQQDLTIVERAAALFPPLGDASGWNARFGRELNATDDRKAFREGGRGLPIVDGKHLSPFRVDVGASTRTIAMGDARRLLRSAAYERARLSYRDVASATNRVTLIAAILPPRCVSTHTVFCLRTPLPTTAQYFLCGMFNSLVVNYLVRLRVTTHVTTAIVERLPIPLWRDAPATCRHIAGLARLLSTRFEPRAFACLNASAAQLYQLTRAELEHVLASFPLIDADVRTQTLTEFASRVPSV